MTLLKSLVVVILALIAQTADARDPEDATKHGYYRVAAVAPQVRVAHPAANAVAISLSARELGGEVAVAVFPELALTGYTAKDLFNNDDVLRETREALSQLAVLTTREDVPQVLIVGAPYRTPDGRLFNVAFVLAEGRVVGAVPKRYLPNYAEFEEARWFDKGHSISLEIDDSILGRFILSDRNLFRVGEMTFGIEICEDLWTPATPSTNLALAGAQVIFNLSASNEIVGKASFRRGLVSQASARLIAGYVYSSSGPSESTTDLVFGGHLLAAEDGSLLAESKRFQLNGTSIVTDIDVGRIQHERSRNKSWGEAIAVAGDAVKLPAPLVASRSVRPLLSGLVRQYARHPFVPAAGPELTERAEEILSIQATGLARRMLDLRQAGPGKKHHMVIGVSGGLDSTLAMLVAARAVTILADADPQGQWDMSSIIGVTMPGFGTSTTTRTSADDLMAALGVRTMVAPIVDASLETFSTIGHDPSVLDGTYENVQARHRTLTLMSVAGKEGGIVVGTGNLSELCLGWCTYNGDHMSMYNVNASVPKTLVRHLVDYTANTTQNASLRDVLQRILATKVSPELLPPNPDGTIAQVSEDKVGPYELNDFFIYHFLRNGFAAEKIYFLARQAFAGRYDNATILHWLKNFYTRFKSSQFKRNVATAGPKVGSVSTSPRGDLRLPDELGALCERSLQRLE